MKKIRDFIFKLLPVKWRFAASELKNKIWGGYKHIYYSQNGEDIVIDSFFRGKKHGFYVDVGAHHPLRYSNTALLYKHGWQGINIDPNPHTINLFSKYRKKDINLLLAVGSSCGEFEYHRFSDMAVNTLSAELAEKWKKKKWLKYLGSMKVSVMPLGIILEKYIPKDRDIDLLTIDAEGMDADILQSNHWDKYRPKIIVIEDDSFNPQKPEDSEILKYLKNRGYRLNSFLNFTLIFERKDES